MQSCCQEIPSHREGKVEEMEGWKEPQHDEEEKQEEKAITKTYLCFQTATEAVEQNAKWLVKIV